ncbi:gephyrin-like molybdotransferase Glp [Cognatiluteimonas profundi]|uniref:molybdopterin molybdotransferase MoeA n=1 Tax=Cognatiluteimonas profundi TaxID=2594501 RepID=UPI00131B4130|nr:gephyrin-like molybdotransferase Glp [Lysobacter profundi]
MTGFPTRVTFAQAQSIVDTVARLHPMPTETVGLSDAHGRIASRDVVSPLPLPPFDNSAMDGFAFRHADLGDASTSGLKIVGEQFAGPANAGRIGAGECIRITTGAPIPEGADTVVMREMTRLEGGRIHIADPVRQGAHIRRAGEDVRPGDLVVPRGTLLTPARVSMLAAMGQPQVMVSQRPTVAVFTTGDELVEPGLPLRIGEIYNSNRALLMGLLRDEGLQPVAWPTLPDDPARMASALLDAASSFDLVLTCGAVSAGEKDFIPGLLRSQGAVHLWKVLMKPGMPLLFGSMRRARFLGLPGNPVSVLATWLTLGRTLLDGLQGREGPRDVWHARLTDAFDKRHARREFLRGRLRSGADGSLQVTPEPADGSHRLGAAARSDALIVLPEGERLFEAGCVVDVLPY